MKNWSQLLARVWSQRPSSVLMLKSMELTYQQTSYNLHNNSHCVCPCSDKNWAISEKKASCRYWLANLGNNAIDWRTDKLSGPKPGTLILDISFHCPYTTHCHYTHPRIHIQSQCYWMTLSILKYCNTVELHAVQCTSRLQFSSRKSAVCSPFNHICNYARNYSVSYTHLTLPTNREV